MRKIAMRYLQRPPAESAYANEAALVQSFRGNLHYWPGPWGPLEFAAEFDYAAGRVDLIALTRENELLAFEVKLTRWRDALHQAFRNTFFASRSYVVLPLKKAQRIAAYAAEFHRRRVGLCAIADGMVRIVVSAPVISLPVQPWLATQAVAMIRQGNAHIKH